MKLSKNEKEVIDVMRLMNRVRKKFDQFTTVDTVDGKIECVYTERRGIISLDDVTIKGLKAILKGYLSMTKNQFFKI